MTRNLKKKASNKNVILNYTVSKSLIILYWIILDLVNFYQNTLSELIYLWIYFESLLTSVSFYFIFKMYKR